MDDIKRHVRNEMKKIEELSLLFIYSLTEKRLKGVKTSLYKMRERVGYTCNCCREYHVLDKEGFDIIEKNIKMISIRQMEMKSK
jgi:hypothetical protein